jgi:serine phosphatase RsbU (regulator of sigma subunit)
MPVEIDPRYLETLVGLGSHLLILCDQNGFIGEVYPQDGFWGYPASDIIGLRLPAFLGLDESLVRALPLGQLNLAEAKDAYGQKRGVGFILMKPKAEIFGTEDDKFALAAILLEAVTVKSLLEKQRRLETIQDRMNEQRQEELEAANRLLKAKADELKKSLEEIEFRNKQMLEELNLASELQKSLLPKEFPAGTDFEFSRKYIPLSSVGGDFFDVAQVDADHIGLVIVDVSGHGVAPAFITAMFKSAFHHFAPGELSPAKVLGSLNREFMSTLRSEHYLTAFYAVFNTRDLSCTFCSAGHPKQLLLRADGAVEELGSMGFFIGMFENSVYEDAQVALSGGDMLFFFTDGVIETLGEGDKPFGREGIVEACTSFSGDSIDSLTDAVIQAVLLYASKPELEDDITFIAARVIESL